MKKTLIAGAALAAMLTGSMAIAQPAPGKMRGPDANQDGVITEAEVRAQARTMFERMDFNKDGKIDKADREARQAERFKMLDTDGSGEVSLAEMTAAREAREAKRAQRMEMRAEAGKGEPGARGGGKWRGGPGMGKRGGHGGGMRGGMMRLDTNKDGAITLAEFEAGALERFKRQDTNNDGQVTKAERDAGREAMKQRWQEKRAAPKG
ncbi:EF-hand domain-containing protein [Blastomonas sp. AAP53]|uniref:EF-hand domain-containing protein n=1 Tax=Blastomonas sp. AAP53 TaxID=1248760 RepID=UPI00030A29EC|nr:EF-hand domain-containing protein [Blastomonas sp. AAP53]